MYATVETKKIRKSLILGGPFLLALLCFTYCFAFKELITTIHDLANISPHVRITVASLATVSALPILALTLVMLMVKAVNPAHKATQWLNKAFNMALFTGIFIMSIGMPAATLLQYLYMPQMGYSPCNILQGHPNKWSNDWVRNSQWCVRGKDRAWVKEQSEMHP
ncbi:hypothetical protein [Paracidovorax konjaci]|uniref:hypothetical protein n=1 Tax=Paracidovorax konjaci TaxID=32040 RepID=UPI0011140305|nr:hypothetical protein [Paracidovorax konjaci]